MDGPLAQPAYTGFLQGVADAHRDLIVEVDEPPPAYALLSHLLDTMLISLVPRPATGGAALASASWS